MFNCRLSAGGVCWKQFLTGCGKYNAYVSLDLRHVLLLKHSLHQLGYKLQTERNRPAVTGCGRHLQTDLYETETTSCLTTWNFKLSVLEKSWTSTAHPALPACWRSRTRICPPSSPSWWRRTGSSTGARSVGGNWCWGYILNRWCFGGFRVCDIHKEKYQKNLNRNRLFYVSFSYVTRNQIITLLNKTISGRFTHQ